MTSMRDRANELLHQRTLANFRDLGYEILDASTEQGKNCPITGRQHDGEAVLTIRLLQALSRLNPRIAQAAPELLDKAIEQLTQSRHLRGLAQGNQDVYILLKDGVKLDITPSEANKIGTSDEKVNIKVIEWKDSIQNDFLLVTNFVINGQLGRGRLDYVGFVNGLPWLLPVVRIVPQRENLLFNLYETTVNDYKRRFPQLFWYNAFILLSDGPQSKMGSTTATWEYFVEWKKIEREDEPEDTSLETLLQGTCNKKRLLDIVENFTLFSQERGGLVKIVARYHQLLGVNAAFARMEHIKELEGKIGVFWHTQGAGKSYSMIFFAQKVHRYFGNWKFVVITDREDLDKQIYENFDHAGVITEPQELVQAANREDLRRLLSENHRIVFTLIQKFQPEQAQQKYTQISDSDQIIVMTDEAHRSQYDTLAENMRTGLPNASFIAFTGTPLIEKEEHETRTIFGPYISKYPFLQAVRDGVTVRLIYENRTPEIQLNVAEVARALQEEENKAGLKEEEKRKVRQELFRRETIITSSARLDFVADDIVRYFMNRGYRGKAMVVSIDKITTVRTYNRVQQAWQRYQAELEQQLLQEHTPERREELAKDIEYMRATEMAVVISASDESEVKQVVQFNKEHPDEQIDMKPHHNLYEQEELDKHFKDPDKPFRLAFVCSMWMTGFDVPCLSTLYLDHPMKDHTLMQALARPNRIYGSEKTCGQIVDYVGIYNQLLVALNIYAQPDQGINEEDLDMPLNDKSELISELERALTDLNTFCQRNGVGVTAALSALETASNKAERNAQIESAANELVKREEIKLNYLSLARNAYHLYQALLPDKEADNFKASIYFYHQVQQTISAAMTGRDLSEVLIKGRKIIAEGVSPNDYVSRQPRHDPDAFIGTFDLSKIDFDELATSMKTGNTYLQTERLRSATELQLREMISVNPKRVDYYNRLQEIQDRYNRDSANQADYPGEIIEWARGVQEEQSRHQREGMSEEELAIADQLLAPSSYNLHLDEEERQQVQATARKLLKDLKGSNKLVLDWYKKPEMNSGIKTIIGDVLDKMLPTIYSTEIYNQLREEMYNYIRARYEDYGGGNDGPVSA